MVYGDWFSCRYGTVTNLGKAADAGVIGDGGHWITHKSREEYQEFQTNKAVQLTAYSN